MQNRTPTPLALKGLMLAANNWVYQPQRRAALLAVFKRELEQLITSNDEASLIGLMDVMVHSPRNDADDWWMP